MTEPISPGDEERLEAEALAKALERGSADPELPEDALKTAALLRYSRDGGALAREREDALLEEVLEAADKIAAREPARDATPTLLHRLRWLLGAGSLSLAAAAILLFLYRGPRPSEPAALPAPDAALLSSQLTRAMGTEDPEFDREMQAYRADVYSTLRAHYEAP